MELEPEKKVDSEKVEDALSSSQDSTQLLDSQTSSISSLGYLADVECGGSSSNSFRASSSSYFDSDSLGMLANLKESTEKSGCEHPSSLKHCSVSAPSVSRPQEEKSVGGKVTGTNSVKSHCFDDILALYDSDSQSISSQEKKTEYSGLLAFSIEVPLRCRISRCLHTCLDLPRIA